MVGLSYQPARITSDNRYPILANVAEYTVSMKREMVFETAQVFEDQALTRGRRGDCEIVRRDGGEIDI